MSKTVQEARELFGDKNIRCTPQRLAVFEALRATQAHPTAEELHDQICACGMALSLATVYNTLEMLCRAGLATRMAPTNGSCRFDANTRPHLHVNLHESSEFVDVPQELGDLLLAGLQSEVLRSIERNLGVEIESLNVELVAKRVDPEAGQSNVETTSVIASSDAGAGPICA